MKKKNYTGWSNGRLTVTGWSEKEEKWECLCTCERKVYYTSKELRQNKPKSCGCLRSPNLEGEVFGRLKAVRKTDQRDRNGNVYYGCVCQCERHGHKLVTAHDLRSGLVRSCGCMATEAQEETGKNVGAYVKKYHVVDGTNLKNLTMRRPKNNTSGHKGVSWDKNRQKWVAQIYFKGKRYHMGRYDKIEDAVQARERAEEALFIPALEEEKNEKRGFCQADPAPEGGGTAAGIRPDVSADCGENGRHKLPGGRTAHIQCQKGPIRGGGNG